MAQYLPLLVVLCCLRGDDIEAFLGDLARNVATNAVAGGIHAAKGVQPMPVTEEAIAPQQMSPVQQPAGNKCCTLKRGHNVKDHS